MPERIQRKRSKGWKMPPNTVYVGRPTKWGNPFAVIRAELAYFVFGAYRGDVYWNGPYATQAEAAEAACVLYEFHVVPDLPVDELRGRDLACWCPLDQPCHADVLLALANQEGSDDGDET